MLETERTCPKCGFMMIDPSDNAIKQAGHAVGGTYDQGSPTFATTVPPLDSKESEALTRRYRDAYLVARATILIARVIKMIGIFLIVLAVVGGIAAGAVGQSNLDSRVFLALAILIALLGLVFYCVGIIVAALGQILLATLDSAVNSSPFLNNGHRARIMHL